MFEVKQVIEGKIFIHHRHNILNVLSMLKILPDILSKYMLNQQIKFGWFILKRIAPIKLLLCLIRANTCCIFIL